MTYFYPVMLHEFTGVRIMTCGWQRANVSNIDFVQSFGQNISFSWKLFTQLSVCYSLECLKEIKLLIDTMIS